MCFILYYYGVNIEIGIKKEWARITQNSGENWQYCDIENTSNINQNQSKITQN